MIVDSLPDIPRFVTGIAEWAACLVYILLMRPRFSRWVMVAACAAALPVLIGVQLLVAELPIGLWTLGMVMSAGTMYAFILLTTRTRPREAGDLTARAFVLAELVASLEWQLHVFFFGPEARLTLEIVMMLGVYIPVFIGAHLAERRHFPRDHPLPVDARTLISVVAVAVVTFLMSNLSFVTTATPFSGRLDAEVFYIRTLVDLCGFVILFALRGQRLELHRAQEVQTVSMMLSNQRERYLQSKHDIDEVNRKYHDLKHYIHAIRAESDPGERARYMDELEESIKGYERSSMDTGSAVLDTMLTAKSQQADRYRITMTVVADGTAVGFLDAMDLVTIIGNALDNAIEAVAGIPDTEKRLIRVAIYRQDSLTMVRVENYFAGTLRTVQGLPTTTKGDARHHGYGLKNMRDTAERYGGSMTARVEDGWFVLRVLLPQPAARR
ncbi:ATP-binding protein [Demequina sp. NBRC 110057]|uniref:ATP-binding protein n=1 Tax=Demequina sp. NBRC 110057 TaxID=1570346 RepID=UPI000A02C4BF|nr:sensor histidine kinase [Demequina sp. NBRC 110057]